MRTSRSISLLTALPFMAVFSAQDVRISTGIERDGTGIRRVVLVADPERRKTVDTNIAKMDPDARWVVRERSVLAEEYRLDQDARFTRGGAFSDLNTVRHTRFGGPSLVRTTYSFSDKITRTAYHDTVKEQKAAPETQFEYSVTMPGEIDAASMSPPGGKVNGRTITWLLKADQETLDVAVTSAAPEWMLLVFVLYVLLVVIMLGLRFGLSWSRSKPRRI